MAPKTNESFPVKLYKLLEDAEKNGDTDIVDWVMDGKGVQVYDRAAFESKILPLYFESTIHKSFLRNLQLWGFQSVSSGKLKGTRYHPEFVRGNFEAVKAMKWPKRHKRTMPSLPKSASLQSRQSAGILAVQQARARARVQEVRGGVVASRVAAQHRKGPNYPRRVSEDRISPKTIEEVKIAARRLLCQSKEADAEPEDEDPSQARKTGVRNRPLTGNQHARKYGVLVDRRRLAPPSHPILSQHASLLHLHKTCSLEAEVRQSQARIALLQSNLAMEEANFLRLSSELRVAKGEEGSSKTSLWERLKPKAT